MRKKRTATEHNKHSYKSLPLGDLERYGGPKISHFNRLRRSRSIKFTTGTKFEEYYLEPLRCLSAFANLATNKVLRRVVIHWWNEKGIYQGETKIKVTDKDLWRVPWWIVDALYENADVTLEYV